MKSLHPAIHGPLLCRLEKEEDAKGLAELGYPMIEVVACNLYPFSDAAAVKPPLSDLDLLEMVDIGGPTMVRASAKNHLNVVITCDPNDYSSVLEELRSGNVSLETRRSLALKAYEHTATYDSAISNELAGRWNGLPEDADDTAEQSRRLPNTMTAAAHLKQHLRYGENSHQAAALYVDPMQRRGKHW